MCVCVRKPAGFLNCALFGFFLLFQNQVQAQDQFFDLGPDAMGGQTIARGISGDGQTVVGTSFGTGGFSRAVYWRPGMVSADFIDVHPTLLNPSEGNAVTATGTLFVSFAHDPTQGISFSRAYLAQSQLAMPYYYPIATQVLPFDGDSVMSKVVLVSRDGTAAIGFKRVSSTGQFEIHRAGIDLSNGTANVTNLGHYSSYTTTVQALSDDGMVFGGKYYAGAMGNQIRGYVWRNGSFVPISQLHPELIGASDVTAISADGNLVLGNVKKAVGYRPFIWNEATQTLTWIETTPNSKFDVFANAFSLDGNSVVGSVVPKSQYTVTFGPGRAFRWACDHSSGHFVRQDIRKEVKLRVPGSAVSAWTLESIVGVSNDGSTVLGQGHSPLYGYNSGANEPWVAVLSLPNLPGNLSCF